MRYSAAASAKASAQLQQHRQQVARGGEIRIQRQAAPQVVLRLRVRLPHPVEHLGEQAVRLGDEGVLIRRSWLRGPHGGTAGRRELPRPGSSRPEAPGESRRHRGKRPESRRGSEPTAGKRPESAAAAPSPTVANRPESRCGSEAHRGEAPESRCGSEAPRGNPPGVPPWLRSPPWQSAPSLAVAPGPPWQPARSLAVSRVASGNGLACGLRRPARRRAWRCPGEIPSPVQSRRPRRGEQSRLPALGAAARPGSPMPGARAERRTASGART